MPGTNDLPRASQFHDGLRAELGGRDGPELEGVILCVGAEGTLFFGICKPCDSNPAAIGNGVMASLAADGPEAVERLHARALERGATGEGVPGPRSRTGFNVHDSYFRDPDGNKLSFFCL